MTDTQVAIVGGGLSGLNTARLIGEAGADFQLFEARDRLGGRILSSPGIDPRRRLIPHLTHDGLPATCPTVPRHGGGLNSEPAPQWRWLVHSPADQGSPVRKGHECPPRNTTTQAPAALSVAWIVSQLSNPASAVGGQTALQHDRRPGTPC